jgi:DNA mismatch repair protein MutS2
MDQTLLERASDALEWPRLLETLAQYAHSSRGASLCRALPLAADLETACMRQQETTEMVALMEGSEPFPVLIFQDIEEFMVRAAKGGVLETQELHACGVVLALIEEVAAYTRRHQQRAPALVDKGVGDTRATAADPPCAGPQAGHATPFGSDAAFETV